MEDGGVLGRKETDPLGDMVGGGKVLRRGCSTSCPLDGEGADDPPSFGIIFLFDLVGELPILSKTSRDKQNSRVNEDKLTSRGGKFSSRRSNTHKYSQMSISLAYSPTCTAD